jgi:predicted esterase
MSPTSFRHVLVLAGITLAAGCRSRSTHAAKGQPERSAKSSTAVSAAPSASARDSKFEPLRGDWLEPLDVEGGALAFVAPPLGATEPRPVMVAIHGGGDRPEWACGGWRLACNAYAFVVCPGGTPTGQSAAGGDRTGTGSGRLAWASSRAIADGIEKSLASLRKRFGERVSAEPLVYAGFSLGATLARPVLVASGARYQAAIFAEGGYDDMGNAGFARTFRAGGGRSVLLVCGSTPCLVRARRSEPVLGAAGLWVKSVGDPLAGHNLNQRMQTALQSAWPEFAATLLGWETFRAVVGAAPERVH